MRQAKEYLHIEGKVREKNNDTPPNNKKFIWSSVCTKTWWVILTTSFSQQIWQMWPWSQSATILCSYKYEYFRITLYIILFLSPFLVPFQSLPCCTATFLQWPRMDEPDTGCREDLIFFRVYCGPCRLSCTLERGGEVKCFYLVSLCNFTARWH